MMVFGVCICIYGYVWISTGIFMGIMWVYMDIYGYFLGIYEYTWVCKGMYGYV